MPALPPGFTPTLLDTLTALVTVIDDEFRIQVFNRACERATGLRFEDVRGRTVWDLIPPEEVGHLREVAADLVTRGVPVEVENHWITKDGSRRLIAWSDAPFTDDRGVVRWIVGTGIDVTDLRRAESLLLDSEVRFHATFDFAPVGMALVALDGRTLAVNPRLSEFLGYGPDELKRFAFGEVTFSDDLARNRELFARAVRGELDGYSLEKRYRRKDGAVVWGHLTVSRARRPGASDFLVAVVEDTTDRHRAEDALRASEENARRTAAELQTVIDTVPAAIFITRDRDARHMTGNRFCAEVLRMAPGHNVSRSALLSEQSTPFRALRDGAEIPPAELPVQIAARDRRDVRDYEFDIAFEDGTTRHLVGNASPLPGGEDSGAVGAFVDISDRKRTEDELRQSQAELQALSARLDAIREEEQARIAHELHDDLGQLLTCVQIDVRTIAHEIRERRLPTETPALLQRATDASQLVDQAIATIRRMATGLRPALLDLAGIEPALGLEAERFRERTGIACELVVTGPLPPLGAPTATALYRIALEALTNVARHAEARHVAMTLAASPSVVTLRIEDDGRGMQPRTHDRPSLGIAGMRERALRVGGELSIVSEPGAGTIVVARVPSEAAPTEPAAPR